MAQGEEGRSLPRLARSAIAAHLSGHVWRSPGPLGRRAGVFVSLHDQQGELRGCIGTLEPTEPDVGEEVGKVAVWAAERDPRFPPVRLEELAGLSVKVDELDPSEPVESLADLDPRRWGVIVTDREGARRGVLLPDLEGVDDVATQLSIVRRKAHIGPSEPIEIRRFTVTRHHEGEP